MQRRSRSVFGFLALGLSLLRPVFGHAASACVLRLAGVGGEVGAVMASVRRLVVGCIAGGRRLSAPPLALFPVFRF